MLINNLIPVYMCKEMLKTRFSNMTKIRNERESAIYTKISRLFFEFTIPWPDQSKLPCFELFNEYPALIFCTSWKSGTSFISLWLAFILVHKIPTLENITHFEAHSSHLVLSNTHKMIQSGNMQCYISRTYDSKSLIYM